MSPPSFPIPVVAREDGLPHRRNGMRAGAPRSLDVPTPGRESRRPTPVLHPSVRRWLTFLLLLPALAVQAWWTPFHSEDNNPGDRCPAECQCVACPAACCRVAEEGRPVSEPLSSLPASRVLLSDESAPFPTGVSSLPSSTSFDLDPGSTVLLTTTRSDRVPLFLRIRTLRI